MWKQENAMNLLALFVIIFTSQLLNTDGALSDKRLCADEKCKTTISTGVGKIKYSAGEEGMVSFGINAPIQIMSKSAGKNKALWGVKVDGREGYAPKDLIRETKVYVSEKNLEFEVNVEEKKPPNDLATSESRQDQENTAETTTTKPLNHTVVEPTTNPLTANANEEFKTGSSPVITPAQTEVVDGTKIPIFENDVDDNVNNKNENSSIGMQPMPKNKNDKNEYDKNHQQHDQFEKQQEPNSNINNVVKENTEEASGNTSKDKGNSEKPSESKDMEKTSAENEERSHENELVEQTSALTPEDRVVNFNASGETGSQNSVPETEPIADNSQRNSSDNTEGEINNEPGMSNSTEATADNNRDNSKANEAADNSQSVKFFETAAKTDTTDTVAAYPANSEEKLPEKETTAHEDEEDSSTEVEETDDVSQSVENFSKEVKHEAKSAENVMTNSDSNPDKKAEVSNDNSAQSGKQLETDTKTYDQLVHEKNSTENFITSNIDKNNVVSNEIPLQSNEILENGIQMTGEMGKEETKDEEYLAEPLDGKTSVPNTDENVGVPKDKPSQSVQTLDSSSNIPGEVLSGTLKDNNYQKDLSSENIKNPGRIEESFNENLNSNSKDNRANDIAEGTPLLQSKIDTSEPYHEDESRKVQVNIEVDITQNSDEKLKTTEAPEEMLRKENINDAQTSYSPPATQMDYTYQGSETATIASNDIHGEYNSEITQDNKNPLEKETTASYDNIPTASNEEDSAAASLEKESKPLHSSTPFKDLEQKENKGLFATIMGTVNNMLSTSKKTKQNEFEGESELDRILFATKNDEYKAEKLNEESSFQYCENIGPNGGCPDAEESHATSKSPFHPMPVITDLSFDAFVKSLSSKILEMSGLLAFLVIVAATTLVFVFGYYCFCNNSREGELLLKLNQLESSLLASQKENAILKHNLMSTRHKLTSIEDNSFGSNDMVVSLKKELEQELMEKARLHEQITALQKELENAADAGIELNKIVSELLSNQTGDESIISSVEELQKQLNEQQNTIFEINASLAEKSRENSELQLLIAEQNARYETELANVHRDNDELEQEKGNLITRLDEMKNDFDKDISVALEGKNMEIKRLQNEILDLTNKLENEHTKWQTSTAKIEALEECLKNIRKDPNINIAEVIDMANVKAQLIEIQKRYSSLKEKLETESDSRKLAENQLEMVSAEVEKLKQDFNQSEKDKLEAQTRLEVLSNYFKDKENQLQKELSVKEAMWLKQQGETTTTVDRLTAMQEEIQSLKSLNDSLRAEVEAQVAAHKAQTGTLENRAHETWLAARQSDRRYEEARAEAAVLRRRLTALAGGNVNEVNKSSTGPAVLGDELTQAPSPIHMESPGSPMLGRMPPPPFLPPPFMGHPPPFIGMPPPPPFVPPGEMRPAPLGRIMSPPPQRSGRFSPQHLDYEDYLDYESNNTWHRHTYSPPPRTYRSLSPTDSRYNYGTERDLISTYDTETDFSPPPSPRESRRRGDKSSDRIDSNAKVSYGNTNKFNTANKGPLSSGSEKSFKTRSHNEMKTTRGNAGGGGKTFV